MFEYKSCSNIKDCDICAYKAYEYYSKLPKWKKFILALTSWMN